MSSDQSAEPRSRPVVVPSGQLDNIHNLLLLLQNNTAASNQQSKPMSNLTVCDTLTVTVSRQGEVIGELVAFNRNIHVMMQQLTERVVEVGNLKMTSFAPFSNRTLVSRRANFSLAFIMVVTTDDRTVHHPDRASTEIVRRVWPANLFWMTMCRVKSRRAKRPSRSRSRSLRACLCTRLEDGMPTPILTGVCDISRLF